MRTFHKDKYMWVTLVITLLAMSVLLFGGYYMDDVILSYLTKAEAVDGGIWNYIGENITSWLHQGRLFPVSNIYVSLLLYLVPNAFVYKLIILLFVVLDVYVLGLLLWKLTKSRWFTLLCMAAMPLLFQIRYYHDGLVAYHLLMQVIMLVIMLTALTLLRFMETKKWWWLVLSLGIYILGILTYEIGFINILVLCFVVFCYEKEGLREVFRWKNVWKTVKYIMPYFLVTVAALGLTVYVKNQYGTNYDGIQVSMDVGKILVTACKQAFAAIPLSYYFLANDNLGFAFNTNPVAILKDVTLLDFVVIGLFLFVLLKNCKVTDKLHRRPGLWGMALVLWWVPALIIGVSARYQGELFWGIGHIPVYVEYFGIMLFAVLLLSFVMSFLKKEKVRKIFSGVIYVGLGFVFLLNLQNNREVTELLNQTYKYSRDILDASLTDDFLKEVPEGATLIVENPLIYLEYPGTTYISYMAEKDLNVVRPEEYCTAYSADFSGEATIIPNGNTFILSYEYSGAEGYVTLGWVEEMVLTEDGKDIQEYYVNQIKVYEKDMDIQEVAYCQKDVIGGSTEASGEIMIERISVDEMEETNGKSGDSYFYDVEGHAQYNSVKVFAEGDEDTAFETEYGRDFYAAEGTMRWCGYQGQVRITNYENEEIKAKLSFTLGTNSDSSVVVTANINDQEQKLTLEAFEDQRVEMEVVLEPGNNYMELTGEGEPLAAGNDGRTLLFRFHDLEIISQE